METVRIEKRASRYFTQPYYATEGFKIRKRTVRSKFVACDTETHQYYGDELLTQERAKELLETNGLKWARENITVKPWALMIGTDEFFIVTQNVHDFLEALCRIGVKTAVWFNGKFDFVIFEHYFRSNGWTYTDGNRPDEDGYSELIGESGQRYKLTIWKHYRNVNGRDQRHRIDFLDLCNIVTGSLKTNLESWKVTDKEGNPVRKLTMDYVNDTVEDSASYLYNDTVGLYYLTKTISKSLKDISGFDYIGGDFCTIGGLSKKVMLQYMYKRDWRDAFRQFQYDYPMTEELDEMFRQSHLYRGGRVVLNPRYSEKKVRHIYKYDVNSLYPSVMIDMDLPKGKGMFLSEPVKGNINIYHMITFTGIVHTDKVPFWQDFDTGKNVSEINEGKPFYIFEEELVALERWYDLEYEYDFVLTYPRERPDGLHEFIHDFYEFKKYATGSKRACAKLILNSSYGKFAERSKTEVMVAEMVGRHIEIKRYPKETEGESKLMNVVIGSYVTALARVRLMRYIEEVCGNVSENFIYCDTDSVHSLIPYDNCDDKELGMLKDESEGGIDYGIYLAPKTYMNCKDGKFSVHSKGVRPQTVSDLLTQANADRIFKVNQKFPSLIGINAVGGKALIPSSKYIVHDIARETNTVIQGDYFYEI